MVNNDRKLWIITCNQWTLLGAAMCLRSPMINSAPSNDHNTRVLVSDLLSLSTWRFKQIFIKNCIFNWLSMINGFKVHVIDYDNKVCNMFCISLSFANEKLICKNSTIKSWPVARSLEAENQILTTATSAVWCWDFFSDFISHQPHARMFAI